MTIKELRIEMMKTKKTNPERAKVLVALLSSAQLIAKEDGNREATSKDIIKAAKKENKMAEQSKAAGAPFNPLTFEVCSNFLPKMMADYEVELAIESILNNYPEKSMKIMGKVMGQLSKEYGDSLDKGLASKKLKEFLTK